jgi:hypothetical protein
MTGLHFAAALLLALAGQGAPAAAPQPAQQQPQQPPQQQQMPEAPASLWRPADDHLTFTTANFDVPRAAGVVHFTRSFEFSHPGEGIDSGLQFESADRELFATIYVYYPGLPHAGLTAFATDWVIHSQSPNLRELGMRVVAAGGHDGVAIRGDYANFRGGLASSAAFIKIGRWIVKLRVSGPETRRSDVEGTMAALLAGLRFNGPMQPRQAAPFETVDCADLPVVPAHLLPETQTLVMEGGITAIMDGAGEEAVDRRGHHLDPLPARLGLRWCRPVTIRIGNSSPRLLRAATPVHDGFGGKTVLLLLVNDAGTIFEQIENSSHHFMLLYHQMGSTTVLGSYDGPLADGQLADILSGADDDGGRFRASAQLSPNGNTNLQLNVGPDSPRPRGH